MGVLEAIARPISRARIEGVGVSVEATVRRNSVEYRALCDGYVEDVFGQFSSIVVRDKHIECRQSGKEAGSFELASSDAREFLELVENGDFADAYVFLLDSMSFSIERQVIGGEMPELDSEQLLTTLSILRQNMRDATIVESPSDTLRRIALPEVAIA
ncbi:MAG: hypothetical protein LVQ95_04015 [Candidatus Micrarchaeales archaeon]|nr:hypothetical protein [Candidatus Micrarchaeales archaeon]